MDATNLDKIMSPDGTPIAFYRSGTGPPLVLVPGIGGVNPAAWTVFPALAEHFTVYAVERRGRKESGDAPTYAIEREFEDIAAVVDSIGDSVYVLGHSFGGLLALEAALLTRNIRKLILYEPLYLPPPDVPLYPEGFIDRFQALLDVGDREGVLIAHYRENVGMSSQEVEQMKSSPAWPARLALAHTLVREMRADEQYTFNAQRFKDLQIPVLLLSGGDSIEMIQGGTKVVEAALPDSRVTVLPGQQHIAMYTAPDLFRQAVLSFLTGSS